MLVLSSSSFKAPGFHLLIDDKLDCAVANAEQGEGSTAKQARGAFFSDDCSQAICRMDMEDEWV